MSGGVGWRYAPSGQEAGVDEVGRGCLAGPVVAAAVILPMNPCLPGLADSKQLSEARREVLAQQIRECAQAWAVAAIPPQQIDRVNILQATFEAMHGAIDQLQVRPDLLLVDGNRFRPYPTIPHQCIVKGDSKFAAIAAASILAKTTRDALMKELHETWPVYNWARNVGYPTVEHRTAIARHGACEHHRQSFRLLAESTDPTHETTPPTRPSRSTRG